jgi:hypothetical protein
MKIVKKKRLGRRICTNASKRNCALIAYIQRLGTDIK